MPSCSLFLQLRLFLSLQPYADITLLIAKMHTDKDERRHLTDYWELNTYVDTLTGAADVWAKKPREWRQQSTKVTLLYLMKAYLLVDFEKSQWPYQTIMFKSLRYCLIRLGFGLNVAHLIMCSMLEAALEQEETIKRVTLHISMKYTLMRMWCQRRLCESNWKRIRKRSEWYQSRETRTLDGCLHINGVELDEIDLDSVKLILIQGFIKMD